MMLTIGIDLSQNRDLDAGNILAALTESLPRSRAFYHPEQSGVVTYLGEAIGYWEAN